MLSEPRHLLLFAFLAALAIRSDDSSLDRGVTVFT